MESYFSLDPWFLFLDSRRLIVTVAQLFLVQGNGFSNLGSSSCTQARSGSRAGRALVGSQVGPTHILQQAVRNIVLDIVVVFSVHHHIRNELMGRVQRIGLESRLVLQLDAFFARGAVLHGGNGILRQLQQLATGHGDLVVVLRGIPGLVIALDAVNVLKGLEGTVDLGQGTGLDGVVDALGGPVLALKLVGSTGGLGFLG